ncbi:unnamed protein product [Effrenium voratum]|uniref:Exostosin GT47 domain-containing protein n=1 Tax=Effrenium voratum TaxID=2562239 RepID=A0AA36N682_9DINO|nr:unnamed protein product [Effrenium voratum]CAJ1425090.1 unnamed protein product [Effrenium voratum]
MRWPWLFASSALGELDRNCWPDFSAHYGICCQEGLPPDERCFDGVARTWQRCCRCPEQIDGFDGLGPKLTRQFFGPLLCQTSATSRLEDFWLPDARRLLRVFIYPLARLFNADLLNRLQLGGWMTGSECDYGLTPCTEQRWNGFFSVYRQFATEVLVLLKFLSAPEGVLTEDPTQADLYVVPYFAKSDCAESGNFGRDPCWGKCKCATAVKHLFNALPYFTWQTRARHLFLATGDIKDLPVEIQAQPLLVSLGASLCGGHVLVPSPNLDPDLQPKAKMETREASGRSPERHILAFWFGSVDKEWRRRVVAQMQDYQKSGDRPVIIHGIDGDYAARDIWQTDANSPQMVLEEMMRSEFCPVVQGDVPHQKRLFDAIITGCLPVVVAFPSHVPKQVSWWLPNGPPAERMVPFWDAVQYRSFVVEVPEREVRAGAFMTRLLQMPSAEKAARRMAMRRARAQLRFDFQGTGPDAFTNLVQEVWQFLRTATASSGCKAAATTVASNGTAFDCGVPPTVKGIEMYGHMACCPVTRR